MVKFYQLALSSPAALSNQVVQSNPAATQSSIKILAKSNQVPIINPAATSSQLISNNQTAPKTVAKKKKDSSKNFHKVIFYLNWMN